MKHPAELCPTHPMSRTSTTGHGISSTSTIPTCFTLTIRSCRWAGRGMNIGAYFYNLSLRQHGGKLEAVLNVKDVPDRLAKAVVADYERGLTAEIMRHPWQSETCIGAWHYLRALYEKPGKYAGYLPPRDVVHWLIDAVSKNGTFILNVPGRPDGTIDGKEIAVLDGITTWMQTNAEAIYETRPWKAYGEGPNSVKAGSFQGGSVNRLGEKDIRFTAISPGLYLCAGARLADRIV